MEKMKSVPIREIRGQNSSQKNNLCGECSTNHARSFLEFAYSARVRGGKEFEVAHDPKPGQVAIFRGAV